MHGPAKQSDSDVVRRRNRSGGCGLSSPRAGSGPRGKSAAPARPRSRPAAPAAPPVPFDIALLNAATALFSKALLPPGNEPIELVIDPLIDGVSGAQSAASHLMEKRLTELAQKSYPRFKVAAVQHRDA